MDKSTACKILEALNESSFFVDQALGELKETIPPEPFRTCAKLLGGAMSDMFDSVMAPIYDEHPDLAPDWYRDGPPRGRPEIPPLKLSPAAQKKLLAAFDAAYEKVQSICNGLSEVDDPVELTMMRQGFHQISIALCRAKVTLLRAELEPHE